MEDAEKPDVKIASCPDLKALQNLFSLFYETTEHTQGISKRHVNTAKIKKILSALYFIIAF